MPMHDWSRVDPGLFQSFRSSWISQLSSTLNQRTLPNDYYALMQPAALSVEEIIARPGDVPFREPWRQNVPDDLEFYRLRKSHIIVRRAADHSAVALVDIVSAGDKARTSAVTAIVERIVGLIRHGINVLLVDVLAPTPRDPVGIHKVIWDEIEEEDFTFPAGKDRILASYETGGERAAYVEPIAIGDTLPDMPLFLTNDLHIMVPLELTYNATWAASAEEMRLAVETGVMPEVEAE
jgi:hypothetical protein